MFIEKFQKICYLNYVRRGTLFQYRFMHPADMEGSLLWVVIFCLTTVTVPQVASSSHCCTEKRCSCSRIDRIHWRANCAGLNLSTSPHFNGSVIWIDLSGNNLHSFPERKKLPNGLQKLNVSYNPLIKINRNSFSNLTFLEELSIANSQSELDSQILSPGIFKDLINLKYLNLKKYEYQKGKLPEYCTIRSCEY